MIASRNQDGDLTGSSAGVSVLWLRANPNAAKLMSSDDIPMICNIVSFSLKKTMPAKNGITNADWLTDQITL